MTEIDWTCHIVNGDSRDIIKRMPDNSVDFIFTDPPYNLGRHSTGNIPLPGRTPMNNDVADWDMVEFNPEEWADEFIRILKPTGNLFIFTSYNHIGRWYSCLDHKFATTNFMVWHKTNPAPKIFKAGFLNSCELIFTCWNKGHTWNFISQKEMHNFFESPICMRPERLSSPKHPAQKPVSLCKKIISIASNPGDVVFDPFMGVGSLGIAAKELNRRFIGIEINNEYFYAARQRLDMMSEENRDLVTEPYVSYRTMSAEPTFLIRQKEIQTKPCKNACTGLRPILKWAGGKEKELKFILPNMPSRFDRFYEPFVGGGSVFMSVNASRHFINDLSEELAGLYTYIASQDERFFKYSQQIDGAWAAVGRFFDSSFELIEIYLSFRENDLSRKELGDAVEEFCRIKDTEIKAILSGCFVKHSDKLSAELKKNLVRKMSRMKELEQTKHLLSDKDLRDNIETAVRSALYMFFRHLYNEDIKDKALKCALFLFIRNYCYSGMFRYNDKGEFNVPYGGIAYNSKTMAKKLAYYRSDEVRAHFMNASISNEDFEVFLRNTMPTENDFIFLDPPYDSEFSTYAQNEFSRADQQRLANYLINDCRAKWMLVIKHTDFIYGLYNRPGLKIRSFDKEYLVSFMNRNDKKATHLLITNY